MDVLFAQPSPNYTSCIGDRRMMKVVLRDSRVPIRRSIWCRPRSQHWWQAVLNGEFGDEWWKENLRMTKSTFDILCNELRPYITKAVTCFRLPISVEKRVAVTLWKLATNVEYQTLSGLFGLG